MTEILPLAEAFMRGLLKMWPFWTVIITAAVATAAMEHRSTP
jgi:hypothetical protein